VEDDERRGVLAALRDLVAGRRDADDESELMGRVAELVTSSLEQLRQHAGVVRYLRPTVCDQLVAVGEPFELVADLTALRGLLAERVRFFVGSREVGEVPVDAGAAFVMAQGMSPGLHEARYEALGPAGVVVQRGPAGRVQVVGDGPVVLLDAAVALDPTEPAAPLRELARRGLHVAWVDFSSLARRDLVRRAIERRALPDGALLTHLREGLDPNLPMDAYQNFVRTAIRRMRASGVAVVGVVSRQTRELALCPGEELALASPAELDGLLLDERWVEALLERARSLQERRRTSDPITFRLDETTRTSAVDGNACAIEFDNGRARRLVLDAIEGASRSVDFQVYIVEDGRLMDHLGAALIRAARRGVRVRLLVDALYSREQALGLRNPILMSLAQQPGVEVRANDPIPLTDLFAFQALKKRDHRKLVVVDASRAFVSGRNAGDAYYTGFDEVAITDFTPHERIPWLDAHIEVRGPLLRDIMSCFEDAWVRNGGTPRQVPPTPEPLGETRARLVVHLGTGDANGMAAYETILEVATEYVYIVNDFPIVSTLAAAVRRALARGVRVVLLTGNGLPRRNDGTFFRGPIYRELFEHMTKGRLEPLLRRGLEAYEYATPEELPLVVCRGGVVRPYVHAKLMSADGRVLSVGSANLDATASFWEREANVVLEDADAVLVAERWIEAALARSWRIDPDGEYWQREWRVRELVARFWPESLYS